MKKNKTNNSKDYFNEGYIVKYNIKNGEYWSTGLQEEIYVKVKHGVNEKNNHKKAEDMLLEKYKFKEIEIVSVIYI